MANVSVQDESVVPSVIRLPSQDLWLMELLMNYLADLSKYARGEISFHNLLQYRNNVSDLLSSDGINNELVADEARMKDTNWISAALFLISTALAVAFLYLALGKRLLQHQTIYDLIVSVESQRILKQFYSIQKSLKVLKHFEENQENLKKKLLGWQGNGGN